MKPRYINLNIKDDQEFLIEKLYNLLKKYYFPKYNEAFNWEIKISQTKINSRKDDLFILKLILFKENNIEKYETYLSNKYLNNIISSDYKLNEFLNIHLLQ